jgi:hypothetical protein
MQTYNAIKASNGNLPLICLEIQRSFGRAFVYVSAPDLRTARARIAPLFPGCELREVKN